MDKRKGYVLLLINAGVRNSVSERKKSRRLLHYVKCHPVITLASKRAFRVLLLELGAAQSLPRVVCPYTLSNLCQRLKTKNLVKIRLLKGSLI
jgi:hypothetical protein